MFPSFIATICIGCFPPPPPPPPPPAPCEGNVGAITAATGRISSRTYGTVTFDVADCITNYIFVNERGIPIAFNNVSGGLTIGYNPSAISVNSSEEMRLTVASQPTTFATFNVFRNSVSALDTGLIRGVYATRRAGVWLTFTNTLFEDYQQYRLSWNTGTLSRVWSGLGTAVLDNNLGGSLPPDITLWHVNRALSELGGGMFENVRMGAVTQPILIDQNDVARQRQSSKLFGTGKTGNAALDTTALWIGTLDSNGNATSTAPLIPLWDIATASVNLGP